MEEAREVAGGAHFWMGSSLVRSPLEVFSTWLISRSTESESSTRRLWCRSNWRTWRQYEPLRNLQLLFWPPKKLGGQGIMDAPDTVQCSDIGIGSQVVKGV